jgi:hypothetical protein
MLVHVKQQEHPSCFSYYPSQTSSTTASLSKNFEKYTTLSLSTLDRNFDAAKQQLLAFYLHAATLHLRSSNAYGFNQTVGTYYHS